MITVIGDMVVDIIVNKDKTNYGTDTDGNINFRPGGQANNVASFIGREGVPCQLIGKVGDDPFGTYLIDESKKHGVSSIISKVKHDKTGSIVLLIDNENGERSMITDRGANLLLSKQDIQGIDKSDFVYLSGYSLFSESTREAAIYAKERAIEGNIPIALDPSSTYFLQDHKDFFLTFLDGITFFFPNYEEGVLLTGEKDPRKIIEQLRKYVEFPILTLGERGCLLFDNNRFYEFVPPRVEVVDTTAAGDSFVGSFLATYFKENNLISAIEYAVNVSSKTVTYYGAF